MPRSSASDILVSRRRLLISDASFLSADSAATTRPKSPGFRFGLQNPPRSASLSKIGRTAVSCIKCPHILGFLDAISHPRLLGDLARHNATHVCLGNRPVYLDDARKATRSSGIGILARPNSCRLKASRSSGIDVQFTMSGPSDCRGRGKCNSFLAKIVVEFFHRLAHQVSVTAPPDREVSFCCVQRHTCRLSPPPDRIISLPANSARSVDDSTEVKSCGRVVVRCDALAGTGSALQPPTSPRNVARDPCLRMLRRSPRQGRTGGSFR